MTEFVLIAGVVLFIIHVMWMVNKLTAKPGLSDGEFMLMMLGTVIFPIGCVHGLMILWRWFYDR